MTLVLAVGNADQFVQVSGRRLTDSFNASVLTEEENKSIIMKTDDARLIGGYSGIASTNFFNTRDWMLKTLFECAEKDCNAQNILLRFTDRATEKFRSTLRLRDEALSIMFSGWYEPLEPPLAFQVIISNHLEPSNIYRPVPVKPKFEYMVRCHETLGEGIDLVNSWIGMPFKMWLKDKADLMNLIISRKPDVAIKGKLVSVVKKFAEMPHSKGTVGKQLNSIVLPRDPMSNVLFDYHSEEKKKEICVPDLLCLTKSGRKVEQNVALRPLDESSQSFLTVPESRKNQPCPCESGLKYCDCHGNKFIGGEPFVYELWGDK